MVIQKDFFESSILEDSEKERYPEDLGDKFQYCGVFCTSKIVLSLKTRNIVLFYSLNGNKLN